jgi:hypothetical protein
VRDTLHFQSLCLFHHLSLTPHTHTHTHTHTMAGIVRSSYHRQQPSMRTSLSPQPPRRSTTSPSSLATSRTLEQTQTCGAFCKSPHRQMSAMSNSVPLCSILFHSVLLAYLDMYVAMSPFENSHVNSALLLRSLASPARYSASVEADSCCYCPPLSA